MKLHAWILLIIAQLTLSSCAKTEDIPDFQPTGAQQNVQVDDQTKPITNY